MTMTSNVGRRGANWTPPSGTTATCFIAYDGGETCSTCRKHIGHHFGGTEYRCKPLEEITFQHDLKQPCACKTCETQLRLDAEAHAKRLAEETKLAQERPTLDLRLDEVPMTMEEVNAYADGHLAGQAKRALVLPGYDKLAAILDEALERAQAGKGKERHANGKPFHEQPIVAINVDLGTADGALYQVRKKMDESKRLPPDRRRAERLDAINYIVASILVDEELDANKP